VSEQEIPYIDKWGFQPIAGIVGFFKTDALPENFSDLCEQYPRHFKMKPYTIDGEPLLIGFYVEVNETNIKEVTSFLNFPKGWWYDRAYLLRTKNIYLLWMQKMYSTLSYLSTVGKDELRQYDVTE
jgi:hypothetical protein